MFKYNKKLFIIFPITTSVLIKVDSCMLKVDTCMFKVDTCMLRWIHAFC